MKIVAITAALLVLSGCSTNSQRIKFVKKHHCQRMSHMLGGDSINSYTLRWEHSDSYSHYGNCDVPIDSYIVVYEELEKGAAK